MNTTVTVGEHEFSITLHPIAPSGLSAYFERHGFERWGSVKIEGIWLSETYRWYDRTMKECREGVKQVIFHPHQEMVESNVAYEYGGDVPMNEAGLDMACRRVQWLAKREPALLKRWSTLKEERIKRSLIGDVTRDGLTLPVTEVKPWRPGNNPHPEAIVYDLPGRKGSLPWWYTLPEPEGDPCGHPRFLCHFPSHIPKEEWWGEVVVCRAKARNENYRTDNGPAFNKGPVQLELEGGVQYQPYQVGAHFEWAMFEGQKQVGELLAIVGEVPDAPTPGLAYPHVGRENPAPVGGGHCPAYGEWVEVTVRWLRYWPDPDPKKVLKIAA